MAGFGDFLTPDFLIPAGISLIGGALGASSAGRAAGAQVGASNAATSEQQRQFDLTRADLAPFREQGTNALLQFAQDNLGPLEGTPQFNFLLDQGVNALDKSAASRGKLLSGQQVKATQQFGTNLANQFANDRSNRVASLAGIGQTATNQTGQFGANAANNIGNSLINAGEARASGFVGQSNAINDSLQNFLLFNGLRNQPSTGPLGFGINATGGTPFSFTR